MYWTVRVHFYQGDGVLYGDYSGSEVGTVTADGHYSITGLVPGFSYTISALAQNYNTGETWPETYLGGGGAFAAADFFSVTEGASFSRSLNITHGGVIKGVIRGADGLPLAGAQVGLWSAGTGDSLASLIGGSVTNSDGSYRVPIAFGAYKVGVTNGQSLIGLTYPEDHPYGHYSLADGRNGLSSQWWNDAPSYDTSKIVVVNGALGLVDGRPTTDVSMTLKPEKSSAGALTSVSSYVALGDSYQSGEGANPRAPGQPTDDGFYYPTTDTALNRCHRSYTAYPELLVADSFVQGDFASWACSGSLIEDLSAAAPSQEEAPWDDPLLTSPDGSISLNDPKSAIDRVAAADPDLVTIGVGGNDMGFAPVLGDCVKNVLVESCFEKHHAEMSTRLDALRAEGAWRKLFAQVRAAAPHARVAALGYAHFYNETSGYSLCPEAGIRRSDQFWINYVIKQLDDAIRSEAAAAGVQYIDVYDASAGHELCQGPVSERYMNGVMINALDSSYAWPETYHPTAYGHRALANIVEAALAKPSASTPQSLSMNTGDQLDYRTRVAVGSQTASFTVASDGTVQVALTSPSGEVIDAQTTNPKVEVANLGGLEQIIVTDPDPGGWKVSLTAAAMPGGSGEVRITSYAEPKPKAPPVAAMNVTPSQWDPSGFTFSAAENPGLAAEYFWDFGDGTTATGVTVNHSYTGPGDFYPTLTVSSYGTMAFASSDPIHVAGSFLYQRKETSSPSSEVWCTDDALQDDWNFIDTSVSADQSEPAQSVDGRVAFVSHSDTGDSLYVPNEDYEYVPVVSAAEIHAPAWSPDGTTIAFSATDSNGPGIFTMVYGDTSGPQRVTTDVNGSSSPSWSPSGERLVYARTDNGGGSQLVTMNPDGSDTSVIRNGTALGAPDWSHVDDRIAFVAPGTNGHLQVFSMSSDGSNVQQLTAGASDAGAPAWSKNDRSIAYTVAGTGTNTDIWTLNVASGAAKPVLTSDADEGAPAWAMY